MARRRVVVSGEKLVLSVVQRLLAVLILVMCVSGPAQVGAQTPASPADLEKQYDTAFQETLRKPADLDVLFRFATLATQTGDLEGAISALERMLLINPDLPRVRLELGVLYFRLGSYEVARTYLEAMLKSPSLPPEVREKAEQFMSEILSRLSPARLTGEVFLGWRYQSNANLGPSTSNVRLFGQTANLNQASVGAPDWGVVVAGTARHFFDFGEQDKSGLETTVTAYTSRQFNVTTANLSLIDFTIGPRFQLFPGVFEEVMLRPFISAGHIWVNDATYYGSYGGGVELSMLLASQWRASLNALWRRHDHLDNWYLRLRRPAPSRCRSSRQRRPSRAAMKSASPAMSSRRNHGNPVSAG
jgi:tetratricopeptide (TPR) repeat protein